MSNTGMEEFSREDLIRVLQRDRYVKEQLASRVGSLMHENLELMGIVQELQRDLAALREGQATLNGEVLTPQGSGVVAS